MSKTKPAFERVGISTLQSVAPCQQSGNTPNTPSAESSKPFRDGHEAAYVWWLRFLEAHEAAGGYFFSSNLREFASILPANQIRQFLDSVGALMVAWIVAGEPTRKCYIGAAHIAFNDLSPEQQDAQFDGNGAPLTALAQAMAQDEAKGVSV